MSLQALNYLCSCEKVSPLYTLCISYYSMARGVLRGGWVHAEQICGLCRKLIIVNAEIVSAVFRVCVYVELG